MRNDEFVRVHFVGEFFDDSYECHFCLDSVTASYIVTRLIDVGKRRQYYCCRRCAVGWNEIGDPNILEVV